MKKSKTTLLVIIATLSTFVATLVASSACLWGWYQPVEPDSLQE